MTILAFEFSSARRSVALAQNGKVLAEAVQHTESRATNAFALIEKVLADANISRDEINTLAMGLGPGSYTGIRAALALAQGWHLAKDVKLLGVSSVAALAFQAQTEKIFGDVNVLVDAQRGEFYRATWAISENKFQEIGPLKIISAAEIKSAGEICVGPEQTQKLFPRAMEIAVLANQKPFVTEDFLEPIYLRATTFVKAVPSREL